MSSDDGTTAAVKGYSDLQKQANIQRLSIIDVPSDGNCALHAIVQQLGERGVVESIGTLRQKAVSVIRHDESFDENFLLKSHYKNKADYIDQQSTDGHWCDEIMLRAISTLTNYEIRILHDRGSITVLKPANKSDQSECDDRFVMLGQIGESHYVGLNSVKRKDNDSDDDTNVTLVQTDSKDSQVSEDEGDSNDMNETSTGPTSTAENTEWPPVWSQSTWLDKVSKYPFLFCARGRIGCLTCKKVVDVKTMASQGVSVSTEWSNCQVAPNGKDRQQMLRSLRKKIFEHAQSKAHMKAEQIEASAKKEKLETLVMKMRTDEIETTKRVFRTAYYIAKSDRPFSDHQGLLELQEANGCDMGHGLKSRFSATEIVKLVAQEMRRKACSKIIEIQGKISVLIDEATSISNKSTCIVYLKCETDKLSNPHFMFLDLVEIADQSAATITDAVLKCMKNYGFNDEYLKNNFVSFASDGASVMVGRKSGVASRLTAMYPNLITWHCLNHRLELAVGDAASECQGINHFRSFMDSLYALYSRSPLMQRQLANQAAELEIQLKKIGRVLNTRWVSSSFRTVSAVWHDYEALASHFSTGSRHAGVDGATKCKYGGLHKKLCSPEFVMDLGLMYDCLNELSMLSLALQNRDVTLPQADRLIRRSIRRIEQIKEHPGPMMSIAKSAADELKFKSTQLQRNVKHVAINQRQFITSLCNNLQQRLFTTTAADAGDGISKYANLVSELAVLDSTYWPNELNLTYGDKELEKLCHRFRLPYAQVRDAFCDFKDNGGTKVPMNLQPLINCANVIPCSTAECERGFSLMNIIISPERSTLLIPHVSALMYIKLHGPPVALWLPDDYVTLWIRRCHRSALDTQTRKAQPVHETVQVDPLWKLF